MPDFKVTLKSDDNSDTTGEIFGTHDGTSNTKQFQVAEISYFKRCARIPNTLRHLY